MNKKNLILMASVAVFVILIDRITKYIVQTKMVLNQTIHVIGNFFTISYIHNSGIAFGLLDDKPSPAKAPILIIASLIALGVILYIYFSLPRKPKIAVIGTGLVFGGAIGNMVDRIIRGEVIDFFDFDIPDIVIRSLSFRLTRFPTFNVADSCVLSGIIILLILIIRFGVKSDLPNENKTPQEDTG